MKHIKVYDNLDNNEPEEGDYVICKEHSLNKYFVLFLENNIGKIIKINDYRYFITYDNIPEECNDYFMLYFCNFKTRDFFKSEIKYWSKNKKDLEIILQANKYNL